MWWNCLSICGGKIFAFTRRWTIHETSYQYKHHPAEPRGKTKNKIDEPTTFLVDTVATDMKLNLPHSTIGGTSTLLWWKNAELGCVALTWCDTVALSGYVDDLWHFRNLDMKKHAGSKRSLSHLLCLKDWVKQTFCAWDHLSKLCYTVNSAQSFHVRQSRPWI